ncbi:MAG TPA: hypothetical protein VKP66_16880 [Steroidobacteraceae bacterium]|nr:hypothetical protein [Steroidobacteraceae bacterium]
MNDAGRNADLARALELSNELLALAERGDVGAVADLDAERLRLLHSMRVKFSDMHAGERLMLQKINALNDEAIGLLEHRRRRTEREMDIASAGRRAVAAYGSHA